jgi:hypothetical protein
MKKIAVLFLAALISCHVSGAVPASGNDLTPDTPSDRILPAEDEGNPAPPPEETGDTYPPPEPPPVPAPVPSPAPEAEPSAEPAPQADIPES